VIAPSRNEPEHGQQSVQESLHRAKP
jgi:hypothetical protein